MAIRINTNILAVEAAHNLDLTSQSFAQAVQRLSSGLRINSAADDPSAMGVSQKLIAQINGSDQAQRNAQDAVSLLQVAQTGLNETLADLQRLNQLAIQASNGTLSSSDLQNIQLEVQGLVQDVDRVAQQTKYNSKILLNGALGASVSGGGADITNLQVQSGTAVAGTYANSGVVTNATQSATQGNTTAAANSTLTGGGSITITGPTGLSQTFTSFAGETVSNFMQQVNNANLGVGMSVLGGRYVLTSNNFGFNGTDANGNANSTGPSAVTVAGSTTDVDFGNGATALNLTGGASSGSIVAGAFNAAAAVNGKIEFGGVSVVLTGSNSDQFVGTGAVAGITFRATNPGALSTVANADSITITQNSSLQFQVGSGANNTIGLEVDAQTSLALGVNALNMTTQTGAEAAITPIQTAISQVSSALTNIGAIQTNLTDSGNLAGQQELNFQTANSNLTDANIPEETVKFTRDQILLQAGTAVLGQANQSAASILGLFSPNGPIL